MRPLYGTVITMRKALLLTLLLAWSSTAWAVVNSSTRTASQSCPASSLSIPFQFQDKTDLTVTSTTAGVTTPLTLGVHYTVRQPLGSTTGSISYIGSVCSGATTTINVSRTVPNTQTTSLKTQQSYSPVAIENALDKLTMITQDIIAQAGGDATAAVQTHVGLPDPHTQYVVLTGRSGGQIIDGGTGTGEALYLESNPGNDGKIRIADNTLVVDEATNLVGIGTATPTVLLDVDGDAQISGDFDFKGGVGAIDTSATASSSMLVYDNVAAGFDFGSAGSTNILRITTTNTAPGVSINGIAGKLALYVKLGLVTFGEDLTLEGAVGAIDTSATASSSMLVYDNVAAGFDIGAAGATDILRITTTDASPGIEVTGIASQTALRVDAGNLVVDENSYLDGNILRTTETGATTIAGGTAAPRSSTAGIEIYGPSHATQAKNVWISGDTVSILDESGAIKWTVTTSGNLVSTGDGGGDLDIITSGEVVGRRRWETFAATNTASSVECNSAYGTASDTGILSLPPVSGVAGCTYTLINLGTPGFHVDLQPAGTDAIWGTCVGTTGPGGATAIEMAGGAGDPVRNDTTSSNHGDYITVISNGSAWYIIGCVGEWDDVP